MFSLIGDIQVSQGVREIFCECMADELLMMLPLPCDTTKVQGEKTPHIAVFSLVDSLGDDSGHVGTNEFLDTRQVKGHSDQTS
jgi:hypothetical protein